MFALWTLCFIVSFPHTPRRISADRLSRFDGFPLGLFPVQDSVHCVQPERVGREDQGGEVQEDPIPLLRGTELSARQNAQPEGSRSSTLLVVFTGTALVLTGHWCSLITGLPEAFRGVHPPEQPVERHSRRGAKEGPGAGPEEVTGLWLSP